MKQTEVKNSILKQTIIWCKYLLIVRNTINFNKTQYIELLKKEEFLKNEGRFLFNENRDEDLELLSYGVILENQIYYNRKAEYIFLVE